MRTFEPLNRVGDRDRAGRYHDSQKSTATSFRSICFDQIGVVRRRKKQSGAS